MSSIGTGVSNMIIVFNKNTLVQNHYIFSHDKIISFVIPLSEDIRTTVHVDLAYQAAVSVYDFLATIRGILTK